ncbi:acyclic terpene utilization AtuA family protein [Lacihabitans soyangensis]|uniref:DUF1446 domain-containing protein n=1 Tax=Lacihabitans soyangensis TaxID=869394 RepID=A0AAE3H499_9BACT|nr:acyclic terpene utilization AtuA family protein [Lacihabitans soyangensis]MCP9762645.1 DUF1446 domain-containing protein [Lacihabitans soyangensis]
MSNLKKIRIGAGAGFSGDRLEPAEILASQGEIDYLILECLAERTIALAQKRKLSDPNKGYDPLLERRMKKLLPIIAEKGIKVISNMGAANAPAAAAKIIEIAIRKNLKIKVAAVTGDDVLSLITGEEITLESGKPLSSFGKIVSANAYLGADSILPALNAGAEVIITGRVADPSLVVAPLMHSYGWTYSDTELIGKATVIGHLLECAGQVTGGYFADGVKKIVPNLEILGHPYADIFPDGTAVIGKVEGTGGIISLATVKEQLLYEVLNPFAYLTPDVSADFTTVSLKQIGHEKVQVTGGNGSTKPEKLKVSVGYQGGFMGEGEILYAGAFALERAKMAGEIVEKRLQEHFTEPLRIDYIGSNAAHAGLGDGNSSYEIRLRVSGLAKTAEIAAWIGEEVEALYTNGPSGGGGVRKSVTEIIGIQSILIDRESIHSSFSIFES